MYASGMQSYINSYHFLWQRPQDTLRLCRSMWLWGSGVTQLSTSMESQGVAFLNTTHPKQSSHEARAHSLGAGQDRKERILFWKFMLSTGAILISSILCPASRWILWNRTTAEIRRMALSFRFLSPAAITWCWLHLGWATVSPPLW